jgi:hypothetical protein
MNDQIDQAIRSIAPPPPAEATLRMVEVPVQITSTGRPVILVLPADLTPAEIMDLTGWMLTGLLTHLDDQAQPRLAIARSLPPR